MMDIIYTGIPAFILSLIASLVIALKAFKGMMEEKPKLYKRRKKLEIELDELKQGMPEKQQRVTKLKLSHATVKEKTTSYMRYYQKLRNAEFAAEKEGMQEPDEGDSKGIQIKKRE
jgi:hypothetical protein